MPQSAQFIFKDSVPETFIRKMKQSEDFVPDLFVTPHGLKVERDSSYTANALKQKFFQGYDPHKGDMQHQFLPVEQQSNYFPAIILVFSALMMVVAKILYFKAFSQLYESIASIIKFRLWLRDTGSLLKNLFLFSTPAHILVLSLTLDFLIQQSATKTYVFTFSGFLGVLILLATYMLVRFFLMFLSSAIFQSKTSTEEQIRNIQIHNTVAVQFMLVLLPFSIYFPMAWLHYVLLFGIVAIEFVRLAKGVISAINLKEYGVFYFFLYFCTVEILPALLLLKTAEILAANY